MNFGKGLLRPLMATGLGLLLFHGIFHWAHHQLAPATPLSWSQIIAEFGDFVWTAWIQTTRHTVTAFGLAWLLAFILGPVMIKNPVFQALLAPSLVFFQTVPLVTIAPFVLVFLGFSEKSLLALATIVTFFPLVNAVMTGLSQWPSGLKELIQWAHPPFWQRVFWVTVARGLLIWLPACRVGWGLALVGTIIAEFYVGSGLGYLLELARAQNQVDLMILCTVAILSLGLLGFGIFTGLEAWYRRWRPFTDFG